VSSAEMPREREPAEATQTKVSSAKMSRKGGQAAVAGGVPSEAADIARGFLAGTRFVVHAAFYCAGRAADRIISLYSGTFRLDRACVADFNRSTGITHAKCGRWKKAIPMLKKALAITPGDQEARMHLAEAYGAANQYEMACAHLEKILEASPNSARAVRALGILYLRRQDYDRAIEHLRKTVELDPDQASAHYRLGIVYDNKKLYAQAIEAFREALRLDPRFANAYQALGFTYETIGDRESAIECFKKALELE